MPRTYDSKKVIITLNGVQITGMADGDFLSVEQTEDRYTNTTGTDGETTRSRNSNRTATATVTVMQGSNGSETLNNYKLLGDAGEDDVFAFDAIDAESGSSVTSGKAWIMGEPAFDRTKEVGPEAWTIALEENEIIRKPLPLS